MKKMMQEFKTFITRGNVMDLAVGVIIGGAFTAIVTALTQHILQPLINGFLYLILGSKGSLEGVYTILVGSVEELDKAIYIDWGAVISAIINFFLVALVLFFIVKAINNMQKKAEEVKNGISKNILKKEDRKALKQLGIKVTDKEGVKKYLADKEAKEQALLEEQKKEEELKAAEERKNNPTTEDLLKDIKALLEKNVK